MSTRYNTARLGLGVQPLWLVGFPKEAIIRWAYHRPSRVTTATVYHCRLLLFCLFRIFIVSLHDYICYIVAAGTKIPSTELAPQVSTARVR
jgi:hypothetical protein